MIISEQIKAQNAALEAEPPSRKVARRIVEDAWGRFIAIKPDYDSIDLGEMLIDKLIAVKAEEIKGDYFTLEQVDARDKIIAEAAWSSALLAASALIQALLDREPPELHKEVTLRALADLQRGSANG